MDTKDKLKITGAACTALLVGTVVYNVKKKHRNRDAALFFSELERNIAPAGVGIIESDAFNMYYWQSLMNKLKKSYYLLKQKEAEAFVKKISDAWGVFNDDEDAIYGVFRALKDQVQVSQVSYWYYQKTKINLIDELRSRLGKEEIAEIVKIAGKLPPYRIAATIKK